MARNYVRGTPEVRFWAKVDRRGPTDCWPWTGAPMTVGYGQIFMGPGNGNEYAHRFSYVLHHGPIPAGCEVDHACHNADKSCPGGPCPHRLCMNPGHLRAVSHAENTRAGRGGYREMCEHGHAMTPENCYWRLDGRGRQCRACNRERDQRRYPQRHLAYDPQRRRAAYERMKARATGG